jgi:hypothetical protein
VSKVLQPPDLKELLSLSSLAEIKDHTTRFHT